MTNKAKMAVLGVLLAGLAAWTGCRDKAAEPPARTELTIGATESFPPMAFPGEDGEFTGYDVDLAREVCRRRGWKLNIKVIEWRNMEQYLAQRQIDCVWAGCTITDDRLERMCFTPGYLRNEQVVVVREDSPIHRFPDLKGKVVSVQAGSTAMEALNDTPELRNIVKEVLERSISVGAFQELEDGHADAVIMDFLVANYSILREGHHFRILEEGLAPEEYGVGFRKDDEALEREVWDTLREMAADGFVKRVSEKWFGSDISIIPAIYGKDRR
ncbi:MAG: transporter substrate-binding domain-containing protein [Kiritimatiellae bacterium]|nr:transporter substrate-binding domain-containing protein [Kiritimatiellia bacterium]